MAQQEYKYFAFISYNSKDTAWGKKLQKKLEHYRMPATLCSEHNWTRTPISPVFFAPTDIQPGGLSEELQERLKASQHLIVICSPNSAKSKWVGREIQYFHNLGRTKNIHFFIVDGIPHRGDPETECFNPIIDEIGLPEILGANIHEKNSKLPWLNRERAYVQLVSKLLGVEFDAIWQRHKRLLFRKVLFWILGTIAVIAAMFGIYKANQSFDADIRLNEASVHNEQLPPLKNAVVTMTLDNETKSDTLASLDLCCAFTNIPHRFLNQPVHFMVTCQDFLSLDTTVTLEQATTLNVRRDPSVYGDVHFWLWNPHDEEFVVNEPVVVDGIETMSGADGRVSLFIPLERQKRVYGVTANVPLAVDSIIMPLAENAIVSIK